MSFAFCATSDEILSRESLAHAAAKARASPPTRPETQTSSYRDEQKLVFEFVKHVATLAAGTLVLLATFLDKVFAQPEWRALIPAIFSCLVISLVALTFAAFGVIASVRHPDSRPSPLKYFTAAQAALGIGGYLVGLMLLSVFAVKNWL